MVQTEAGGGDAGPKQVLSVTPVTCTSQLPQQWPGLAAVRDELCSLAGY